MLSTRECSQDGIQRGLICEVGQEAAAIILVAAENDALEIADGATMKARQLLLDGAMPLIVQE